jgi:hypothetical protein
MPQKRFDGFGFSAAKAEQNSNDVCDQWISDERAAGRAIKEDSRSTSPAAQNGPNWTSVTTLNYHI